MYIIAIAMYIIAIAMYIKAIAMYIKAIAMYIIVCGNQLMPYMANCDWKHVLLLSFHWESPISMNTMFYSQNQI